MWVWVIRRRGDITAVRANHLDYPRTEGDLPILFGDAPIDARPPAPLAPGRYVAVVRGWIADAPGCGGRTAVIGLGFS